MASAAGHVAGRWPRVGERLAGAAFLVSVAAVGVAASLVLEHVALAKVVWLMLAALAAVLAASDLRLGLAVLLVAVAFPLRTGVLGFPLDSTLVIVAIVAGRTLAGIRSRELALPRELAAPAGLLLAGALIGAAAGPDFRDALLRIVLGLLPAIGAAAAVATALQPRRDLRLLTVALAFTLCAISVVALSQHAGAVIAGTSPLSSTRANATFGHPNVLGGYLAANLVLLLAIAAHAWRRFPLAALVFLPALCLGVAGIVVTLSRGAVLGLAAGLLALVALSIARRQMTAALTLPLLGALVLAVVIPATPESQREMLQTRLEQTIAPAGMTAGRPQIYALAQETIADHPLTGVGPLAFGSIMRDSRLEAAFAGGGTHAHSLYLESYLSLGPLGTLGLARLLGGACIRLLAATRRSPAARDAVRDGWAFGLLGALVCILVQGGVDFIFWELGPLVFLMVVVGMAYALGRRRGAVVA